MGSQTVELKRIMKDDYNYKEAIKLSLIHI